MRMRNCRVVALVLVLILVCYLAQYSDAQAKCRLDMLSAVATTLDEEKENDSDVSTPDKSESDKTEKEIQPTHNNTLDSAVAVNATNTSTLITDTKTKVPVGLNVSLSPHTPTTPHSSTTPRTPPTTEVPPVKAEIKKKKSEETSTSAESSGSTAAEPTPPSPSPTTESSTVDSLNGTTRSLLELDNSAPILNSVNTSKTADTVVSTPQLNTSTNTSIPDTTKVPLTPGPSTHHSDKGDSNTIVCDAKFYGQWITKKLTCGGDDVDVTAAVSASACLVYGGEFNGIPGQSCVSLCRFPACIDDKWSYTTANGFQSSIYKNLSLISFMNSHMVKGFAQRVTGFSAIAADESFVSTKECTSFEECSCSAFTGLLTDEQKKLDRTFGLTQGVIKKDETAKTAAVITPVTKAFASTTIALTGMISVAAAVGGGAAGVGGVSTSAMAAASSGNTAVASIDVCQFMVFVSMLKLEGGSYIINSAGKQLAASMFLFYKLDDNDANKYGSRRLSEFDATSSESGISTYCRNVGIDEDMLFLSALAGVATVLGCVVGLFLIAYALSGLFMSRRDFMANFYDRTIGFVILILIVSQYAIGVTATYQIYRSIDTNATGDPKLYAAISSIVFLAFGIIIYGYYVVKRHEEDIKDVGTPGHLEKKVCLRYGPLYDEYKYRHRFFFAPKMMLALISGCVTGYVGISTTLQLAILLASNVVFFLYLEIRSPYNSRFAQTTTSFVTLMKMAVLILTFFLISAASADGFPTDLQHGVSLTIVGLNAFMIFILMLRGVYAFYRKYKLQKAGKYDEEDQPNLEEYFRKERSPYHDDRNAIQQPPTFEQPTDSCDYAYAYDSDDRIARPHTRPANGYDAGAGTRMNRGRDVVEL
uniref:Carbohydratebinding protein putative n=1 Tax=Albugo laibachii Nc14 TaxID=890382 RepID=F0W5W6_9STRA|nr:carbohydratebinding protein putative [Albugo laibachii Nc14]|eukprot:CCA16507.1 carbohydratebinding protein putative [Albugo laibachii Nc14]